MREDQTALKAVLVWQFYIHAFKLLAVHHPTDCTTKLLYLNNETERFHPNRTPSRCSHHRYSSSTTTKQKATGMGNNYYRSTL